MPSLISATPYTFSNNNPSPDIQQYPLPVPQTSDFLCISLTHFSEISQNRPSSQRTLFLTPEGNEPAWQVSFSDVPYRK